MKGNSKGPGTVTPLISRKVIREQAANWLVRLDSNAMTEEERAALRQWIRTSQQHHATIRELAREWDQMSILAELSELFPLAAEDASTIRAQKRLPIYAGLAVAAALVLGVTVTFRTTPAITPSEQQVVKVQTSADTALEITSVTGEQKEVTLSDGSRIRLNTRSLVRVQFTPSRRQVSLVRGEASFTVTKDPARPFVVEAGNGLVEAVGTAFNIELTGDASEVTVTEGIVRISSHGETPNGAAAVTGTVAPVLLNAGGSVRIESRTGTIAPVPPGDLERNLAWQQGSLIFKGETLEQALTEVSRYTDQEIIIVDPTIRDLHIGGHFKTNDIDGLLDTLGKSFDLTISTPDGQRILVSHK